MLGTGSSLLSASQPGARAERVVHPLPRGAQIAQGLVARSARTERAPARLRQRRLADAPGAARKHDSAAAIPQPAHGPLLFRVGPGPPCAAPSHLHVTARHRAPHDTHPSRPPRWDFAHHAMTFGTRQALSLHGRLPRACHLPVTVRRTESSLWVVWSGGFVPWHLSCESIAQLENGPASPEARVFFPAETQPFVLGGIKMNCASKFIATCRSHGLRQAPHSIKSRCGILSGSLEGFPRDQNERTSSDRPRDARDSGAYRGARPVPTDRAPARLPACLSRQGLSSTRPCPDLLREATGSARRHGGEQLTDPRQ